MLDELTEMQRVLLGVHWRLRDYSLRPEAMDFVDFSKNCWFGGFDIGSTRVIQGDLAIGEHAINEAAPEHVEMASSIASERHLAINWLHGYSEVYSETDTSTSGHRPVARCIINETRPRSITCRGVHVHTDGEANAAGDG